MSTNTVMRVFGLRFNWIGVAVLTGVLCSLAGMMLLFAGGYEMERSKSVNWAVIAGYILLLPTMLVGHVMEYANVPGTTDELTGMLFIVLIQLSGYIFLFWAFRKARRSVQLWQSKRQ